MTDPSALQIQRAVQLAKPPRVRKLVPILRMVRDAVTVTLE